MRIHFLMFGKFIFHLVKFYKKRRSTMARVSTHKTSQELFGLVRYEYKNNNMARRSERGHPTKWGVLVREVGQAFWHNLLLKSQKVGRLCHRCCCFC